MMNVNEKKSIIEFRDGTRGLWKQYCETFLELNSMCKVIESCRREGNGVRRRNLIKFTEDAFVTTTKLNIKASQYHHDHHFQYILHALVSQDPFGKCFWAAKATIRR